MELSGNIASREIVKLKFSVSGIVSTVNCSYFKTVKKGELLASLDKKELQAYLDRALKYYEAERAEFDEKVKKGIGDFEKIKIQSSLDISVKNVEIAKSNLDATNLYSPINGIVVEMDTLSSGVNISPSNFVITLINPDSYYFEAEIKEEDIESVTIGSSADIQLKALKDKPLKGTVESIGIMPIKQGVYPVYITLQEKQNLRLGLSGTAAIA